MKKAFLAALCALMLAGCGEAADSSSSKKTTEVPLSSAAESTADSTTDRTSEDSWRTKTPIRISSARERGTCKESSYHSPSQKMTKLMRSGQAVLGVLDYERFKRKRNHQSG